MKGVEKLATDGQEQRTRETGMVTERDEGPNEAQEQRVKRVGPAAEREEERDNR